MECQTTRFGLWHALRIRWSVSPAEDGHKGMKAGPMPSNMQTLFLACAHRFEQSHRALHTSDCALPNAPLPRWFCCQAVCPLQSEASTPPCRRSTASLLLVVLVVSSRQHLEELGYLNWVP